MGNEKVAPNTIDNSPGRELALVIKDQLKKSKEANWLTPFANFVCPQNVLGTCHYK
jgi:hypothetical protein